jgi:hypothetical protein
VRWHISLIALALTSSALSQTYELRWSDKFGGSGIDHVMAVAPDPDGGVYLAGTTPGIPDPLTSGETCFVAHYSHDGLRLWLRQFGTHAIDRAFGAAPDGAGGVYVVGHTNGVMDSHSGGFDAFVVRFNAAGDQLWAREFGTPFMDTALGAAPGPDGGVYVVGETYGIFDSPSSGNQDAFVSLFDAAGNQQWVRQNGGFTYSWAQAATPDSQGGVYLVGSAYGHEVGSNYDILVSQYDAGGQRLWERRISAPIGNSEAFGVAFDGALYITGTTTGDLAAPPRGGRDGIVGRLSPTGDTLWIRQFGSTEDDYPRAAATDGQGGVVVAGFTQGSLFAPSPSHYRNSDAFLVRFDQAGNRLWDRQFGSADEDGLAGVWVDPSLDLLVGGWATDPLGGQGFGVADAYVARLSMWCGSADFNGDGDIATDADIEAFFSCIAGDCCSTCGSADFNSDGDTATDADIEAFFRVLAGSAC